MMRRVGDLSASPADPARQGPHPSPGAASLHPRAGRGGGRCRTPLSRLPPVDRPGPPEGGGPGHGNVDLVPRGSVERGNGAGWGRPMARAGPGGGRRAGQEPSRNWDPAPDRRAVIAGARGGERELAKGTLGGVIPASGEATGDEAGARPGSPLVRQGAGAVPRTTKAPHQHAPKRRAGPPPDGASNPLPPAPGVYFAEEALDVDLGRHRAPHRRASRFGHPRGRGCSGEARCLGSRGPRLGDRGPVELGAPG